jgi:hypothetical protein
MGCPITIGHTKVERKKEKERKTCRQTERMKEIVILIYLIFLTTH